MKTKTIIIFIILLLIGILFGYFVLPAIIKPTTTAGIGEGVFGTSPGMSPPLLP